MNSSIDLSFADIISRVLPSHIPCLTSTTGEIQPTDDLVCVVASSDLQHVSGNLHTGTLSVGLVTPALPDNPDLLADHRAISKAIFDLLSDGASVSAAWQSDDLELRGTFLVSTTQGTDQNRWQSTWQLKIGVATI